VLLIDPRRVTLGLRRTCRRASGGRGDQPEHALQKPQERAEAVHVREAMAQDGAAMCEFYAWLEKALGSETITELTIDEHLSAARARRPGFVGLSFNTIAGFNANGAMPHYRATPESHATIVGDGLLLIDSGGQYLGGTTDITRVWPIGNISEAHRRDYTLVLKGTIALSRTRFPRGTLSPMLDAIARAPLWDTGSTTATAPATAWATSSTCTKARRASARRSPTRAWRWSRHDHQHRAGLVPPGRWGVRIENLVMNVPPPHAEATVRRVPRVRDAHAVPDRHALHRARPDAPGRDRLAERLPRDGSRAAGAARRRRRDGLADRAHRAVLSRSTGRVRRVRRAPARFIRAAAQLIAFALALHGGAPRVRSNATGTRLKEPIMISRLSAFAAILRRACHRFDRIRASAQHENLASAPAAAKPLPIVQFEAVVVHGRRANLARQ
jgi:hypothetical protein